MIRLAELIARHSGRHQTFFASSGAEANEGAIKLARKWGGKHRNDSFEIITMEQGFHGRTLATMSASGKPHWERLFEPKVPGFRKLPLNRLDAIERAITAETVALMLEPIQGEAGVFVAEDAFLRDLRALTRRHGILLILDEIQTGIGRTGTFFAFEHAGIAPDIMTLGKGWAAASVAALVAHEDVCCFAPGDQGGTFGGNAFATAVGCAVMEEIAKPGFLERVTEAGAYLTAALAALSSKHGCGAVRGKGLLLALDLNRGAIAPRVAGEVFAQGLLINAPRPDTLRFMRALTVGDGEIDRMIAILDGVLTACGSP